LPLVNSGIWNSIPLEDIKSAVESVKSDGFGALERGIEVGTLLVLAPHLLVADALDRACVNGDESATYR